MIETLLKHSEGMDRVVCGYKRILKDGRCKDYLIAEKAYFNTQSDIFRESADSFASVAFMSVWNGLYRRAGIEQFFNEEYLRDEDVLFNLDY